MTKATAAKTAKAAKAPIPEGVAKAKTKAGKATKGAADEPETKPKKDKAAAAKPAKDTTKAAAAKSAKTDSQEVPFDDFEKGQAVSALYEDGHYYDAVVKKVTDKGVKVVWDDGSEPSLVAFGNVRPKSAKPSKADKTEEAEEPKAPKPKKAGKKVSAGQQIVNDFLRDSFGYVENDDSFYVPPHVTDTELAIFVLGSPAEIDAFLGKVQLETVFRSGRVVAFYSHNEGAIAKLRKGVEKKGLTLEIESTFDPRGVNLATWTDEELTDFVVAEQLASKKKASGMDRDTLEGLVDTFYFGVDADDTEAGATAADDTDVFGEKLANAYDKMVAARAVRGQGQTKKDLMLALKPYREDLFAKGRKSRIGQLRKLLKASDLSDDVASKLLDVLMTPVDEASE